MSINILTGGGFRSSKLKEYFDQGRFKHPLWVHIDHYKLFESHPILHSIFVRKGEQPFFAVNFFCASNAYYNISQFNHPWKLFTYYLYHRQVTTIGFGASFEIQNQLVCHGIKRGFTENYWITPQYLEIYIGGDCHIIEGAKGISLFNRLECNKRGEISKCYNIEQTNDPKKVKGRMIDFSRSIISNKVFPTSIHTILSASSVKSIYKSNFWFNSEQVPLLGTYGVTLDKNATGVHVNCPRDGPKTYFNVNQTSDPLQFHKAALNRRESTGYFRDFSTFGRFRYIDCVTIRSLFGQANITSRYFIKKEDLSKFGAIVLEGHRNRWFRLSGVTWYNLDQLANKPEVIGKEFVYRKQRENNPKKFQKNIDILDDILSS